MNNVTRITGPVIPTKRTLLLCGLTHQGRRKFARAFGKEHGLPVYVMDRVIYQDHAVAEKVLEEKARGKEPCVVGIWGRVEREICKSGLQVHGAHSTSI